MKGENTGGQCVTMNRPLDLTPFSAETSVSTGSFASLADRSRRLSEGARRHAELVGRLVTAFGGEDSARRRLGSHYESLTSLTRESDSLLFFSGLISLGQTLAREERSPEALQLFSAVAETAPENLTGLRDSARRESEALTGVGAMAPRIEVLARGLARQATDPVMLLSMGGAQVVFGGTRLALLSRLTSSPTANALTRGFGARALASVGAFAVEGPAFMGLHHGLNAVAGRSAAPGTSLSEELAATYLTLGGLKLAAWAGTGAFNRVHGINPLTGQATRLTGISRVSRYLLPQASTLAGLYAGHELEVFAGLRPRTDGATTFVDSLATLVQFAVAGRLMHGAFGPEFARLNQEINLRTELTTQSHLHSRLFGSSRVQEMLDQVFPRGRDRAVLATPEGLTMSAETPSRFGNGLLMMANGDGNNNGGPPSVPPAAGNGSIPPGAGNGSVPPPPGRASDSTPPPGSEGLIPRIAKAGGRVAINNLPPVLKALGFFDWNRFHDPHEALRALHTGTLPTPPESIEMGILRALGHNSREQLDSVLRRARRDLGFFHEHGLSRTRSSYFATERMRQDVQRGERERLAPILPIYRTLVEGVRERSKEIDRGLEAYEAAAQKTLGDRADTTLADAVIDLHWALRLKDDAFRETLNETELERLGYEPVTAENASDKFDFFVPGAIETMLARNPILGGAAEAEPLREASRRQFFEALPRQIEARRLVDEVKDLEIEKNRLNDDSPERNATRITAIEAQVKEIGGRIKTLEREALGAARPLKNALTKFLADPARARAWTLETALHASLRAALHENSGGILDEVLPRVTRPEGMSDADWSAYENRAYRYQRAVADLTVEKNRTGIRSPADILARATRGRDYQAIWRAMGEVQRATSDIFSHNENLLFTAAIDNLSGRLATMDAAERDSLVAARDSVRTGFRAMGDWAGERLAEMSPFAEEYFRYHDASYKELRAEGARTGLRFLDEIYEKIVERPVSAKQGAAREAKWNGIRARVAAEIETYLKTCDDFAGGRVNPRDFNRRAEDPTKSLAKKAFPFIEREARRARLNMGTLPRIVPLYENYTLPFDLAPRMSVVQRWGRVGRYALPAVKRMVQLFSADRNAYPFKEYTRRFIDYGRVVGDWAGRQTFYVPEHLPRMVRYFRATRSDAHWTHLDFIGNSANSVQADRGALADATDSPDIVAKFDLAVPVIDQVFPFLVNSISNDRSGVRAAEIRAAQIQSFGFPQEGRLFRMDPLNYDAITMAVPTARGPFVGEVHEPVNESWMPIGRVFHINEGSRLLTGRQSGISLGTDIGAIRNYPNQRGPFLLDNNPTSYTHIFLPANAFPEGSGAGKSGRLNLERMLWFLQAHQPELNPPAPSTYRLYRRYAVPGHPEVERQVEQLLQGFEELYPTETGLEKLQGDAEFLRTVVATGVDTENRNPPMAQQALAATERATRVQASRNILLNTPLRRAIHGRLTELNGLLETDIAERLGIPPGSGFSFAGVAARLRSALLGRFTASEAQLKAEETVTLRRYQRILASRIRLMDSIEGKIGRGTDLNRAERRLVERLAGSVSTLHDSLGADPIIERVQNYLERKNTPGGHPHAAEIATGLQDLIRAAENSDSPESDAAAGILRSRLNQARRAFSHLRLGMEPTPAEQVLLENLTGSFAPGDGVGPRDALVDALRAKTPPTAEELDSLVAEERIREYTRRLINKTPGKGTGSIDPLNESTRDLERVRYNADGEIVGGPSGRLTTYPYLFSFLGVAAALGVAGTLDLATRSRFNFYNATAHRLARFVYSVVGWKTVVSPESIRALERGRIESRRQGRPLTLNANHTSWADIGALTTIFPEGRFVYKTSLEFIPFLNLALLGGRHIRLNRPTSRDPVRLKAQSEKAELQLQAAGPRMVRYGVSVETFVPGTRSLTGSVGKPKTGAARIATGTNAITLANSLFGFDQIVPWGTTAFTRGVGTHRRSYMDFRYLDPQEANLPTRDRDRVAGLTKLTQERIVEMFLDQVAHLRAEAESGDAMAEGQLAQFMSRILPGMDLVRAGRTREARDWATSMKTDPDFLETFTAWWDAQTSTWHPPR